MLGANQMMIGLLLCVFSVAAITAGQYAALPEIINVVFYACVVVGGVLFIMGLALSVFHHGIGMQKGLHSGDATVSAMALIRCMIATSVADGHLHDEEIATILKIYTQLTGSRMDESTVREAAAHMQSEGTDIIGELANIKSILDNDLKLKIIRSSLYILAADGALSEDEEFIIDAIREGLGISKMKFKGIKASFLESKNLA